MSWLHNVVIYHAFILNETNTQLWDSNFQHQISFGDHTKCNKKVFFLKKKRCLLRVLLLFSTLDSNTDEIDGLVQERQNSIANALELCRSCTNPAKCNTEAWIKWSTFYRHFKHIEAEAKWLPFCRWHFQKHFLEWKCMNFDQNFTSLFPRV